MGKLLSNLITPLILLLLTSLMLAFVRSPIDEFANENRIKAEVELAASIEPLEAEDDIAGLIESGLEKSHIDQILGSLGFARVTLHNDSSQTVTNISFELPEISFSQGYLLAAGNEPIALANGGRITIPDMEPGDRVFVAAWGTFPTYDLEDDFESFSSEGPFRTEFYLPESQDLGDDTLLNDIFDFLIWGVGTVSALLLLVIAGVAWSQHFEFLKLLLTYPRAYEAERSRFWEDPRKWKPDWQLLNEKHYRPHDLFGDPDDVLVEDKPEDRPSPD
jgi:hypothetical protein